MLFTNHFMLWAVSHPGSTIAARHYVKTILDGNKELREAVEDCIRIEQGVEVEMSFGARNIYEYQWELSDRLWQAVGKIEFLNPTPEDPDDYAVITIREECAGLYDLFQTLFKDYALLSKRSGIAVYKFRMDELHMLPYNPETIIINWFVTMYQAAIWG